MSFNENQCPFCKTEVNQGATVCHRCGAFKGIAFNTWGQLPIFVIMFLSLPITLSFSNGSRSMDGETLLMDGICFGLIILIFKLGSKSTWLRRN
jgi:hypothetical protein